MKKRILISVAAAGAALSALQAQEVSWGGVAWQILGKGVNPGFGNPVVRGKPFSATEEQRFVQVLGDGTRIETKQENKLYRDSEGRTRIEESSGRATITDPVGNLRAQIDPASKSAKRVGAAFNPLLRAGKTINPATEKGVMSETTENLRPENVNGVTARGVRTTVTIPRGEIGNDREIKVVSEVWYSEDLQMVIKSTNSDPRFGDNSYQLTNIVTREPDAALFKVPEGYAFTSPIPVTPGVKAGTARSGGARSGVTPVPAPAPGSRIKGGRN